jgi:phosphopantetheinyl transferase (holo-ACP synthase)
MKIQRMTTNQEILVELIQLENPPLNIYISEDFCTKGRMLLRNFISNELKMADNLENLNLSISHTNKIGAALCTTPSIDADGGVDVADVDVIGLDIEEAHRITEKLIQRIANSNEFALFEDLIPQNTLSPSREPNVTNNQFWKYLWPIKEASFKAFHRYQKFDSHTTKSPVKTISEIKIKNICCQTEGVYHFTTMISSNQNLANGITFPYKEQLIAVAWVSKHK